MVLWSTSATAAGAIGTSVSPLSTVFFLQFFGAAVIWAYLFIRGKIPALTANLVTAWQAPRRAAFVIPLLLFSAFITLYHFCFYSALQYAPNKLHANAVNYLWPLGLVIISRPWRRGWAAAGRDLIFTVLSFLGIVAIIYDGGHGVGFAWNQSIAFALGAAFCAPIYMRASVFLIRALGGQATFAYAIGLSLALVIQLLSIATQVNHIEFDWNALALLSYSGVLTLAVAHICWSTALEKSDAVAVPNMSYFVPVLSTVLLYVIFGDELSSTFLIGASLIAASNIVTNRWFRFHISEGAAVVAFFFLCYLVYFRSLLETPMLAFVNHAPALIAILSGFLLMRMWEKLRKEENLVVAVGRTLMALQRDAFTGDTAAAKKRVELARQLIYAVTEFDFEHRRPQMLARYPKVEQLAAELAQACGRLSDQAQGTVDSLRRTLSEFCTMRLSRGSAGEWLVVACLALVVIADIIINSGESYLADMLQILTAVTVIYIVVKIREYDMQPAISDLGKMAALQEFLKVNKFGYFLPSDYLLKDGIVPDGYGDEFWTRSGTGPLRALDVKLYKESWADGVVGRILLFSLIAVFVVLVMIAMFGNYTTHI